VVHMKNIYYNAGIRIRFLREKRRYTREKLSEMAEISPKFLYEIETGSKGFSADTLYKLAKALDTNADYILCGESEKSTENKAINIFNRFEDKQKKNLIEILELICKLSEEF